MESDEPPVFQFARADRHREAVAELEARGQAYRDYMTAEELEAERETARAEGRVVRSPWRDADPATWPDRPYAVRLKSPLDGETVVEDAVKGEVRFQNAGLDDLILLRSDGEPDLQSGRGGRRPRHGHHPRDPRRRSPEQCRPSDGHLPGPGLGGSGLGPPAADPRTRRRQAVQAPRRPGGQRVRRHGLSAGNDAQLSGQAGLGPWRRRDLLRRPGHRMVRHQGRGQRAGPPRLGETEPHQQSLYPRGRPGSPCDAGRRDPEEPRRRLAPGR